jgi:hypothetical protein
MPQSSRRCATSAASSGGATNGGYAMLLPFDLRPDREGWTVFDIETDLPAFLDGLPLTGLSLDDAEEAVNALNALEFSCWQAARRHVLDERVPKQPRVKSRTRV